MSEIVIRPIPYGPAIGALALRGSVAPKRSRCLSARRLKFVPEPELLALACGKDAAYWRQDDK